MRIKTNIFLKSIKCQYHPKNFKHWKYLHEGPEDKVLEIKYSPHVRFLNFYTPNKNIKEIKNTHYYKMHRSYGKSHKWTLIKINKFIELCKKIKKEGYDGSAVIFKTPMFKNSYNDSFEIYEGHHRLAICYFLNYEKVFCNLFNGVHDEAFKKFDKKKGASG